MDPANKRQKMLMLDSTADWKLVFRDVLALKSVVNTICSLTPRATFRVKSYDESFFLVLKGADAAKSRYLHIKLLIDDVVLPESITSFTFCVASKDLKFGTEDLSMNGELHMLGHVEKAKIVLKHKNPLSSFTEQHMLDTIVDEEPQRQPIDLDYDLTVDFDVHLLKRIITQAKKRGAEKICIRIYMYKKAGRDMTLVQMQHAQGMESSFSIHNEKVTNADGSFVINACSATCEDENGEEVDNIPDVDPEFSAFFNVESLSLFLNNLTVKNIQAKMKQNVPLLICHNIGPDESDVSFIRFMVAPAAEDEYDD